MHQRKLLDEDKREVRLFQEAFLEDGELHSDKGRERKFRWKNNDDDEDSNGPKHVSDEEGEDNGEVEEKRRLERIEREKFLQEAMEKESEDKEEDDSQFFNMANKVLKR